MDWDRQLGTVACVQCGEAWSGKIHHLSEPVDVYSDWLDACEAANS
jgi:transcription elongation factor Elf1